MISERYEPASLDKKQLSEWFRKSEALVLQSNLPLLPLPPLPLGRCVEGRRGYKE